MAASDGGSLRVRLHGMFAGAPEDVRRAVVSWLRVGRRARGAYALLDAFVAEGLEALPEEKPRRVVLRPIGETYDLSRIAADHVERHFADDFRAPMTPPGVTWGRRGRSRPRYSLRLGSYYPEDHLVRVHAVLDQPLVPEWFVAYVLFHELLHAALPPRPDTSGRWIHHSPTFNRRERSYPDYERALAWEEANLPQLIRSARSGRPIKEPRKARAKTEAAVVEAPSREERWCQGWLF